MYKKVAILCCMLIGTMLVADIPVFADDPPECMQYCEDLRDDCTYYFEQGLYSCTGNCDMSYFDSMAQLMITWSDTLQYCQRFPDPRCPEFLLQLQQWGQEIQQSYESCLGDCGSQYQSNLGYCEEGYGICIAMYCN
jgi:hypothetical protein